MDGVIDSNDGTFMFTSESVGEGHPGEFTTNCRASPEQTLLTPLLCVFVGPCKSDLTSQTFDMFVLLVEIVHIILDIHSCS